MNFFKNPLLKGVIFLLLIPAAWAVTAPLACVATAVYQEAGNQPYLGKLAVARVIQNRFRKKFARDLCGVVYQRVLGRCQFVWACAGHQPLAPGKCQECWQAAWEVIERNQYQTLIPQGLFFHARGLKPHWPFAVKLTSIGGHEFYGLAGN